MLNWPKKSILLLFLATILILPGCSGGTPTADPQTEEPTKLKLLVLPYMSFVPFHIAQEEGYFAEQNLEVEFVQLWTNVAAAAATGEVDIVTNFVQVDLLSAMAQGADIKFVAGRGYFDPDGCTERALMIRRDSFENGDFDDLSNIAGKGVDLYDTSIEGMLFETYFSEAGITLDDVQNANITEPPLEMEVLTKGEVDLIFSVEPWVTFNQIMSDNVILKPYHEILPDAEFALIVFGPNLLVDDRDAGQRFINAYLKAVQQLSEGKTDRNMEHMLAFTGLDREILEQACWPIIREDGKINTDSLIEFQEWAVGKGYLERTMTPDEFWDGEFVENAAP